MAIEQSGSNKRTLKQFIHDQLQPLAGSDEPVTGVGCVRFDNTRQLAILGFSEPGVLLQKQIPTPAEYYNSDFFGWTNRIYDLSYFKSLSIDQISDEAIEAQEFKSSKYGRSISFSLPYNEANNRIKNRLDLNETDILQIFTRERGGLVVFEGAGLPEENALLLDKGQRQEGYLFFIHPERNDDGLFSVDGWSGFLSTLEKRFTDQLSIPLQERALEMVDRGINGKHIRIEHYQEQLFRLMVIANARMFNTTEHRYYQDFLNDTLHGLQGGITGIVDRRMDFLNSPKRRTKRIKSYLEEIYSTSKYSYVPEKIVEEKKTILDHLKTERIKELRKSVGELPVKGGPRMDGYVEKIFEIVVREARTEEEFTDLQTLLNELDNSSYARQLISFIMWNKDGQDYLKYCPDYVRGMESKNAKELLARIEAKLVNRRDKILFPDKK